MKLFSDAHQATTYFNDLYGRRNIAELERYADAMNMLRRSYGHSAAYLCSSPGRVELVGNHLDHNGGKVVAGTVNRDIVAAFAPNNSGKACIAGMGRNSLCVDVNSVEPAGHSAGLIKGIARSLRQEGFRVGGFDACTNSVIPTGAGLSSSAAFELFVGSVFSELFNGGSIPKEALVRAGVYAENTYFGKPCGPMDQSVIAHGGTVALDFADGVAVERLEALCGVALVLIATVGSHSALSDLYAAIPADMAAVAKHFGKTRLIEVDPDAFFEQEHAVRDALGDRCAGRARHFFTEQRRVERAESLLRQGGDYASELLAIIDASGESSLRDLQNCAVDEQDTAIADIMRFARDHGCAARVHGGGFAGTVLCAMPAADLNAFAEAATAEYGAERVFPVRLRSLGTLVL